MGAKKGAKNRRQILAKSPARVPWWFTVSIFFAPLQILSPGCTRHIKPSWPPFEVNIRSRRSYGQKYGTVNGLPFHRWTWHCSTESYSFKIFLIFENIIHGCNLKNSLNLGKLTNMNMIVLVKGYTFLMKFKCKTPWSSARAIRPLPQLRIHSLTPRASHACNWNTLS